MLRLVSELGLGVHDQFTTGDALLVTDGQPRRFNGLSTSPAFRFSAGAESLVDALVRDLVDDALVLDAQVERIERAGDDVVVHVTSGPIRAAAVVLALPPPLAVTTGMIEPSTLAPDVAVAATYVPVWMGGVTKAVAVYERAFWRELGLSGMVSDRSGPFGEIHDMSGPAGEPAMLFGFGDVAGPHALTAEVFVQQLVGVFGPVAASPLAAIALDWSAEKFTRPVGPNNSQRYDLYGSLWLRRPSWAGRLHWASTETGAVAPGHLEGALEAAERTVRDLTRDGSRS